MTVRDNERNYPADTDEDRVVVSEGVPTDRVRWGPILAGMFGALTLFAVLNTLGAAIGLSASERIDDPRKYAIGAGIWGIISLLLSFGFGGWLAGRSAAVRGGENGLLNGFLVAGVGIPVLMFVLGSAAALAARAAITSDRETSATVRQTDGDARQASAVMGDARSDLRSDVGRNAGSEMRSTNGPDNRDDVRRAAKRTAWGTLVALVLSIAAASVAGLMGAKDDTVEPHRTIRRDRGDTIVAG